MKLFILWILMSFSIICVAQRKSAGISIGGGPSFNGSGDMIGYDVFNQVDLALWKRFYVSPGLQFTSHANYDDFAGLEIRHVVSGTSLYANINYLILNKSRHRISLGAGPILRYQSNSLPFQSGYYRDANGQLVYSITYDGPINTLSIGYNFSPAYQYRFSKRMFIGFKGILQNDTRADIISSAAAFVGLIL